MKKSQETSPTEEESKGEENTEREATPVTILDTELEALKEEASDFKDKYWRLLAESENSRKRLQKEKQELTKFAVQNFVSELLPPLDHFEKALHFADQMSDEVKNWAKGFEMILAQFREILTANGIKPFESVGKPFDPHLHEAVETVETTDHPHGTVVEEMVRGYMMGDRTLRPARVKVAKAPSQPLEPKEEAEQEELEEQEKE